VNPIDQLRRVVLTDRSHHHEIGKLCWLQVLCAPAGSCAFSPNEHVTRRTKPQIAIRRIQRTSREEKGTITLMDALRKMSLMPAEMLERSTPAARQKGRLQEGADADIVVFDAGSIRDRSTFEKPMEPSVGVRYLVVGGTVVVDEGKIAPDVFPGCALLGPGKRSASHD